MRGHILVAVGLLLTAATGWAQSPPPAPAYAVVGARIETGDGTVLEKGTVLVRDGLIEAVGAQVAVPPEAQVIPGDGLVVYPGFIDALNSGGLALPAAQPQQDAPADTTLEAPAAMREANRTGIRPELRAAEYLALTDAQLVPLRQAGFTTAMVAPTGGILDGVGAVVNLGGQPRREAVIASTVALHAGFRGSRGAYPGSLMGVFALFRQTMLDAQRYGALQTRFRAKGGRRPPEDATLASLQPVLAGELPVVWDADSANEIRRVLALSTEFGFKPIISGGAEAWKVAPLLAERKVPVILALNFAAEPRAGGAASDEPEAALRERKRLWDERVANAVKLHQAGVRFAFTTRGTRNPAEFLANLRKVIAAGLPREAALQALTRDGATLLGIAGQSGTLAPGKAANLSAMTAPFTDASAKTRWMFVDGRRFQPERERVPAAPMATPAATPTPSDEELEELTGGHVHPRH